MVYILRSICKAPWAAVAEGAITFIIITIIINNTTFIFRKQDCDTKVVRQPDGFWTLLNCLREGRENASVSRQD